MAASDKFGAPLTRIDAPQGAPPKAPVAGFAWRPLASSVHPPLGSWPDWSFTEMLQWQGSHGGPGPIRHAPRADRSLIWSSTEVPR
eukprot:5879223-Pyramimonas_sp.AAC.1